MGLTAHLAIGRARAASPLARSFFFKRECEPRSFEVLAPSFLRVART